ncbi:hypothetical protein BC629DRAFT_1502128 [Irpex lacteus]|nr:hypothetical protein BC629DRAFT_1502128 [Irpex lacteus]
MLGIGMTTLALWDGCASEVSCYRSSVRIRMRARLPGVQLQRLPVVLQHETFTIRLSHSPSKSPHKSKNGTYLLDRFTAFLKHFSHVYASSSLSRCTAASHGQLAIFLLVRHHLWLPRSTFYIPKATLTLLRVVHQAKCSDPFRRRNTGYPDSCTPMGALATQSIRGNLKVLESLRGWEFSGAAMQANPCVL